MNLYTRTEAARIVALIAALPADAQRAEIAITVKGVRRIAGYVWRDTSGESVHAWRLYTPFHPATVSVRDSAYEAVRYVEQVFATFKGHKTVTHLDNPALLS